MCQARGMGTRREREVRALFREQARSGLTVKAFAERRGMSPETLYWWRCELRRRESALGSADLVEVEVSREPASDLEIRVSGDEVRITVPEGFDAEHLRRLVTVLRRC